MDNASLTVEKPQCGAPAAAGTPDSLGPTDTFVRRHIGPRGSEIQEMLRLLGCESLDELIEQTIPAAIRLKKPLNIGEPRGEFELLENLRKIAVKNKVFRSYIGMGYSDTI